MAAGWYPIFVRPWGHCIWASHQPISESGQRAENPSMLICSSWFVDFLHSHAVCHFIRHSYWLTLSIGFSSCSCRGTLCFRSAIGRKWMRHNNRIAFELELIKKSVLWSALVLVHVSSWHNNLLQVYMSLHNPDTAEQRLWYWSLLFTSWSLKTYLSATLNPLDADFNPGCNR